MLDVALTGFWRGTCGGTGADFMNPADSRFVVRGFAFLKRQALGAKEKAHDDGRAPDKIEFVQCRHEEMAAFMASAHAKFTGELGVCIATSGPGASHLITGLYDARMDHMPVLAITGQQARTALGGHYQQELDLVSMFKDVAGAFVHQATAPSQVRHLVDRAVRTALGERRVTALILPNDLQEMPYEEPARAHGTVHSGVGFSRPRVLPYETDLQRAADVLNAGKKLQADDRMRHAADDRLGLPVLRVPAQRRPGARRADRLEPGHAQPALPDGGQSGGRRRRNPHCAAAAAHPQDRPQMAEQGRALARRLGQTAAQAGAGSCANWYARDLQIRAGMMCSLSGGLASMGAAVPYAIAAKFAHPQRPVIALVGDGAMQMNNMAELITVAKYWKRWGNGKWVCAVFNNQDLNQVTWEQRVMEGDPKFAASQDIPDVPYHLFAISIGLKGIYVEREEDVAGAWEQALSSDVPVLIEFKTDPNVAPLPPHIKLTQAKKFAGALLTGDPDEVGIIKQTAKQIVSSVLPGRGKGA
nr:acetolactate synthase [Tanacetum cinerariifolium]